MLQRTTLRILSRLYLPFVEVEVFHGLDTKTASVRRNTRAEERARERPICVYLGERKREQASETEREKEKNGRIRK